MKAKFLLVSMIALSSLAARADAQSGFVPAKCEDWSKLYCVAVDDGPVASITIPYDQLNQQVLFRDGRSEELRSTVVIETNPPIYRFASANGSGAFMGEYCGGAYSTPTWSLVVGGSFEFWTSNGAKQTLGCEILK